MRLSALSFSVSLALTASAKAAPSVFDTSNFKPQNIIKRDVAVIGGGSAGTYAAIALKDAGKSVMLVEKKWRMGGHANTYTDPETNTPVDMGVIVFHNITEVRDFYDRFDLALNASQAFFQSTVHYDFRTGEPVSPSFNPTQEETLEALKVFGEQYDKYPYLANGTILPDPVPEELYSSTEDFVEKYGIEAAVPPLYWWNAGVGDFLSVPIVEQFRYLSSYMVDGIQVGFISPVSRNVSEIFAKAEDELASEESVLLSSEVVHAHRPEDDDEDVKLVVRTPSGLKLIIAKKLVIAIPPKVDYLAPFDLSRKEKSIFKNYINSGYYVGIIKNTGFPDNDSISNAAEGNSMWDLPQLPGVYSFAPAMGLPGLQMVTYATPQTKTTEPLSDEEVKTEVIKTVKRIQEKNPDLYEPTEPEFVDFHSHAPYNLQVRAEDIKSGHYDRLYSLQGKRNTHWTGAVWKGEDTSLLWKYTKDIVVPEVLEGL